MTGSGSTPDRFQACIILCGLPASGKSTLATKLETLLPGATPVQGIDVDEVRNARYSDIGFDGEFLPGEEAGVRERKLAALASALGAGMTVIDDDMNYFRSMRKEIVEACCAHRVHYAIIHVSTPLKRCLAWNETRGQPVPDGVIRAVARKIDKPGSRAYAWDAPLASINLARVDVDRAATSITTMLASLGSMISSKEAMRTLLGNVSSIVDNVAFWNLARATDVVGKGYLVKDIPEWKDKLQPGGGSILETFDLSARRLIGEHASTTGPLQPEVLATIKEYKQRARVTLKSQPDQLQPLLEGLKRVLRNPGQ